MKFASLSLVTTSALLLACQTAGAQIYVPQDHQNGGCAPLAADCCAPATVDCCAPVGVEGCVTAQGCDWNACGVAPCCHAGGCNGHGAGLCPGLQYDPHSNCPMGMCASSNGCLTNSCLSHTAMGRFCAGKAYPDAGWAPPARLPVNRDRIWYSSYLPQTFYGSPGGQFVASYPQVYQPTDTTQLGYYYANVPTWQTRPGMIPPAPNPAMYHARVCPHGGGYGACQACGPSGAYSYMQPQVAMQRPQIVRPPVRNNSGSRRLFSLTSLTDLID